MGNSRRGRPQTKLRTGSSRWPEARPFTPPQAELQASANRGTPWCHNASQVGSTRMPGMGIDQCYRSAAKHFVTDRSKLQPASPPNPAG